MRLELGNGFAYVDNQLNLNVEGDVYFLDLLFYNYYLHCFVVFGPMVEILNQNLKASSIFISIRL